MAIVESPEALTQYGNRIHLTEHGSVFRNRPRVADADGLSLQVGALPPLRIRQAAMRRSTRDGDGVRLTTETILKQAGFTVMRTPTRMNPGHASVRFDGEWTDEVAARFDSCFTEGLFVGMSFEHVEEVNGDE
jgi:hypothetical protein